MQLHRILPITAELKMSTAFRQCCSHCSHLKFHLILPEAQVLSVFLGTPYFLLQVGIHITIVKQVG